MLGNVAQANTILNQVEGLINKADQLDLEAQECFKQIERDDRECQALHADIAEKRCKKVEWIGKMANLRARLINLQRRLQKKGREFEEKRSRVFQIRDKEGRYSDAAAYKEGEAKEAEDQAKEEDREAQELQLEKEQLCGHAG